ncbi:caspase family protein [Phaeobacter marinintestinus]|uniref:caspase family protein n=1 Tax=Falsiphaeobacter marinintestinus TaxID=1492905 RepID=UPI0011B6431D|nr:caspase family protein [Phaeobacter marinintestinus]
MLAAWLVLAAPAQAETRLALVIGNQNYGSVATLDNPVADARLMARTLEDQGFDVTLLIDTNRIALNRGIAQFGRALRGAGQDATGLFYYAGHGVQSFGTNYLLPTDVSLTDAADLDLMAIPTASVLRQMASAKNRRNIVILDACRDNPFVDIPDMNDNGLAEMKAPTGTFISYSTSPGAVATDGTLGNSPFTLALSRFIPEPGLPIELLFRQVRIEVLRDTQGLQTPWDTSSLTGEFVFSQVKSLSPEDQVELQLWETIRETRDPVQLVLFLRNYRNSAFAPQARDLLTEILSEDIATQQPETAQPKQPVADPQTVTNAEAQLAREQEVLSIAQDTGRVEDYIAYLEAFPDGAYSDLVRAEVEALSQGNSKDPLAAETVANDQTASDQPDEAAMIEQAAKSGELDDYQAYLAAFPEGVYAELAKVEIAMIQAQAEPAAVAQVAQESPKFLTFVTPLTFSGHELDGQSIADLIDRSPLFPPFEGLSEELWKDQSCSNCHNWTQDRLCDQAQSYSAVATRAARIEHPYGGMLKKTLKVWAEDGCK